MKITHIIFDLDGTLIDSSSGIVEAFNHALKKFNLPPQSTEEITPMIGFPVEIMFGKVTDQNIPELKQAFRLKAMETVVAASVPLPGATQTIESLFGSNLKLGIATTKIRSHVDGIMTKLGWNKYFDSYLGGDDVKNVKPHPEQFEFLLNKMNGAKQSAIVVGDTTNDLLAARAMGVPTVAVRSPYGTTDDVLKLSPEYFIENINELPGLIDEINTKGVLIK